MSSQIILVAEAVKDVINAATFSSGSPTFTATRGYVPEFKLEDMTTAHVTVIPREIAVENTSRGQAGETYSIDIAIQQRPEGETNALFDVLSLLVEEIMDILQRTRLSSPSAMCTSVAVNPIYSPEHIRNWMQFTSVITAEYKLFR